ncbi:TMEM14 family protein [Nodosilinea sp. LEGE 06152]|uniref:TMEM14 family protein n=1 Tax=Nodosilinea sp. LEGE 06152 TaxID=2777966 RepID=UPI00188031DE|nr:TMEM14 family protein [Nodosilinea sp. LEGE 06152]MBE9156278.1 TMEM14 family protein [Nodosilinea sp. LEGE 06152]
MLFLIVAIAPWLLLLYAVLVLAGGVMGYLKARSKPSLISGLISGAALLIAWWITLSSSYNAGIGLATCLAIALLIIFSLRFRKTNKVMPAGLMAIVSLLCAAVFAIALSL